LRLLHGWPHRHTFCRRNTAGTRFCRLLSDCARRTRNRVTAGSPIESGAKDSLPVDRFIRRRGCNPSHTGPGYDDACLQSKWLTGRIALFSLRRSRLRRSRGAWLSCARRRSFMAIGGGFHGAPPQVGLALFPRIVAVTFVLWRTVPARHCGAPKPFVGELNESGVSRLPSRCF